MFVHHQTSGLVFKKINRGEADQIFTIFTKDYGRADFFAKGTRKIKSKIRGGIRPFTICQIEFIQGKNHKILIDARTLNGFPALSKSLVGLRAAWKAGEVLGGLFEEKNGEKDIWNLVNATFDNLNKSSASGSVNGILLDYYCFFWSIVSLLGFHPSFYDCAICRGKAGYEPLYFSSGDGGMICGDCFKKTGHGNRVDADMVDILQIMSKGENRQELEEIKFSSEFFNSLRLISEDYYAFLSGNRVS